MGAEHLFRPGELTAAELRTRLFQGAVHTEPGMTPGGVGALPVLADEEFMNEGHGSYFARENGKDRERERTVAATQGEERELANGDAHHHALQQPQRIQAPLAE